MMKGTGMRSAMAMIELIFAIVIIAISVITIPSMMSVANNASKGMMIDEDILKRMMGEIIKVSQARWDQNLTAPDFSPLLVAGDLPCNIDPLRGAGTYRSNPDSGMMCSNNSPMMAATPVNGDLNLSRGLEQLHNREYNMTVTTSNSATVYQIPIKYNVSYVTATTSVLNAAGTATATWQLGSSANMNPGASAAQTHLKRIVVNSTSSNSNMTLTFFKSNVGKFAE